MILVVDPGHGGTDPGAVAASGAREKDITLAIALELEKALKPVAGLQVYLTRRTDVTMSLTARAGMADRIGADLVLSIHINASRTNLAADWVEAFCWAFGGPGEKFARALAVGLGTSRPVLARNFFMLREPDAPAALVELGFMSNAACAAKLARADYQHILARGLAAGVCDYWGLRLPPVMDWRDELIQWMVQARLIDSAREPGAAVMWWELASVVKRVIDKK